MFKFRFTDYTSGESPILVISLRVGTFRHVAVSNDGGECDELGPLDHSWVESAFDDLGRS